MDRIEDFELFVTSKGLKLSEVDEQIINDYCTDVFYDVEDEDDLNELNAVEEQLRKQYLGE